tara:strand:+ start:1785 stop:2252 length:468 start_codon:yes stop_codon:yes gene_type:complete
MKINDQLIIALLRENSRMTLTKMSKKTSIPVSTLYQRLKSYKEGIVKKHTALVDFNKLGFTARARVLLKVDKKKKEDLRKHLLTSQFTNELHKVNNGYDFMAELIFKSMKELEAYVDTLDEKFSIKEKKTFYIVDEIKEEGFLSKPDLIKIGENL